MVEEEYEVIWTPDFAEDVYLAVDYIQNHLKSPMAAKDLFEGITAALEIRRVMPTAAVKRVGPQGQTYYLANYKNYDAYYEIEGRYIKVIGLKHQLQK